VTDLRDRPPLLLPRPRSIRLREAGGRSDAANLAEHISTSAPYRFRGDEAYRLEATPGGVQILAPTPIGAAHGRRTLEQLRRQYGDAIPAMLIEDAPAFPVRGVMLDISRDRIPTMAELVGGRGIVESLSALKFNHLQFYTEHTFAYAGHEEVWEGWDPLTPAEMVELCALCRRHHVELAANQNCFGHLAQWLRRPRYAELAETQGEWVFEYGGESFARRGPFSLCPIDPRSLALVEDLLGQLLPCVLGNPLAGAARVNIGCDETYDVGFGRSGQAVRDAGGGGAGRATVCARYISAVCGLVRRLGGRPMFWADMVLRHPEAIGGHFRRARRDATALVWDYEPGFGWAGACRQVREAGLEAWVCPGTSSWRSIIGRTRERRINIAEAARQGLAAGASGFLVTDWGDTGHHQQWPIALNALAFAADQAWTGGQEGYDPAAASLHAFGDAGPGGGVALWLDELGDADAALRAIAGRLTPGGVPQRLRNSSALFLDLHTPLAEGAGDERTRRGLLETRIGGWNRALGRLRELEADPRWRACPECEDEIRHTLDVAILAAERAVWRRRSGAPASGEDGEPDGRGGVPCGTWASDARAKLAHSLEAIMAEHRRLWLKRSRPAPRGLEDSCGHYQRVVDDLLAARPAGEKGPP
jgi:hexosaminidase